ncbi:MAG: copper resistance CopC/CopD family protein [Thermoplasmatota archaeon]
MKLRLLPAALLLLVAAAPMVAGHAVPAESSPASGSGLDESPTEVWIRMTQKVDPLSASLDLVDPDGTRYDLGDITVDEGDKRISAPVIDELPDGGYLLEWEVLSVVDGHTTSGAIVFAVGDGTVPAGRAVESPSLRADAVAGRALEAIGFSLLAGAVAFALWVGTPDLPWRRLLLWGGGLHLLGTGLFAFAQLAISPLTPVDYLTETTFGQGVLWRTLLAATTLGLAALTPKDAPPVRGTTWLFAAVLAAIALLHGRFSHGAEFLPPLAGTLLDGAHLLFLGAWIGGLVPLALLLRAAHVGDAPSRFSRLATIGVLGTTLTGVALSNGLLGRELSAWQGTYGRLLAAKIALVALIVAIAWFNRRLVARTDDAGSRAALRKGVVREVGVALAVFAIAGALLNLSPPVAPENSGVIGPAPPLFEELHADDVGFHLFVAPGPALATPSTFDIHAFDRLDNSNVEDATRLTLVISNAERGIDSGTITPEYVGGGSYVVDGSYFATPGTWKLEIRMEHPMHGPQKANLDIQV